MQEFEINGNMFPVKSFTTVKAGLHFVILDIMLLPGGKVALLWEEQEPSQLHRFPLKLQIFDEDGTPVFREAYVLTRIGRHFSRLKTSVLPDGNILVLWREKGGNIEKYPLKIQIFDSSGNMLLSEGFEAAAGTGFHVISIEAIVLSNGNIAVQWRENKEGAPSGTYVTVVHSFDKSGNPINPHNIPGSSSEPRAPVLTGQPQGGYTKTIEATRTPWFMPYMLRSLYPRLRATLRNNNTNATQDTRNETTLANMSIRQNLGPALNYEDAIITKGFKELRESAEASLSSRINPDLLKVAFQEGPIEALQSMLATLEDKKDRTGTEEEALQAIQLFINNASYIDEATREEFQEAVSFILTAESMKDLLEGVDFTAMKEELSRMQEDWQALYKAYITETEGTYKMLASLLGIDVEEELLPDDYIVIANLTPNAKRKLLVDLRVLDMAEEGNPKLTDSQKKVLELYTNTIEPLNENYKSAIRAVVDRFIFNVRMLVSGAMPSSRVTGDGKSESLLIVDKFRVY
jgi:hypothetical protein